MKGKAITVLLIVGALGVTAWWMRSRPVDVTFATAGMDFARLEHEYCRSRPPSVSRLRQND